MLCAKQNPGATLIGFLLLMSVGGSSLAANVAQTDNIQHSITLRVDSPSRKMNPRDLGITAEGRQASIVSVMDASEAPVTIALVIDAGPRQSAVLSREKALASSLILELSDKATDFIVIRAGYQATNLANWSAGPMAVSSLQTLIAEPGKRSSIPIYKAVTLAIEELSSRPGIRVLIIIAEGNDSRSGISYKQLRASAEAQHVAVMTALVADHSARGSRASLHCGWDLRSLASDTGAIFLDNDRNPSRTLSRLTEAIRSLRLVAFEIDRLSPGRYRVHTSSNSVGRLHAQKAVVVGGLQ
jgi:hypothetical protein